ncbi:suppressor of fused domain protein [Bradyrhizobium barranii]
MGTTKPRAELMWYVREPTPEICANLRWLANLPFIDTTWFGFGHRVAMPAPPMAGTEFQTFLFLTPIIGPDKSIAEALEIAGDPVEILTVNLISDRELALIKSEGLDPLLDLLDENDYPPIFDPARKSYV